MIYLAFLIRRYEKLAVDQYFEDKPDKPLRAKIKVKATDSHGSSIEKEISNPSYDPENAKDTLSTDLPSGLKDADVLSLAKQHISCFLAAWLASEDVPRDTAIPCPYAAPAFELFP
jgi:hypothetical protein